MDSPSDTESSATPESSPLTESSTHAGAAMTTEPPTAAGGRTKRGRRSNLKTALMAGVVVLAGLVTAQLLVNRLNPRLYAGTVLQQDEPAPSLDGLRFASGEAVDLAAFDDEVTLVFFGYTNCPDICPATLNSARVAVSELSPELQSRVNLLMVTVDPERDTPEDLQRYVQAFNPAFRAVTGPRDVLDRAATLYGVYYAAERVDTSDEPYLVEHTTSLMGIGPDGALRVIWASDVNPKALTADLQQLLS